MVQIDWKRILALSPDAMTEKDKDELYETVAWHLPDYSTDRKHLIHFVRVTQEILKFKSHQVDSLMNELDDIAAKQGEEEARDRQDLLDEIDQLKQQLEYLKRLDRESGRSIFGSGDELKSEVVRLEMQMDEVLSELQEREKELMKEKKEVENYASQLATLQREKEDLKRELTALQEESRELVNGKNIQGSPEFGPEKQEELTDLIRQKNKHIEQLLDDIESLEKQNLALRAKLTNVCDELSDATSHINDMTMHLSQMKCINDEMEKKLADTEEKNKSLLSQIEELSEEKEKHDKKLDQFTEAFNSKVQEWKEILEAKEMDICKAEEEIRRLLANSMKYSEYTDMEVNKKLADQEEQIVKLKNELLRATSEINSCTDMIENFKEKQAQMKFTDADQFRGQILIYEERIRYLEEKLRYAEEDAQAKAEEISEVVIQLREYEMGEFGLSEAMNKIKQLERNLEKRDLQIEKLVQSCNNLEIELKNLEEQNLAMRDRLGLSASKEIDTTSVRLRFRKDLEVIENLKFELDRRGEELIKAKLRCRKLTKYIKIKRRTSEGSVSSSEESKEEKLNMKVIQNYMEEKSNVEKRLLSIVKENDALRKGMHEILESIHKQDAAGTVEIQSSCLERLLEALDSRHVSGWYHPAMRLQAQLNNIEGKNEELRNQIRSIRKEERSKSSELEDAYIKIRHLENQLFITRSPRDDTGSKIKTPESEQEDLYLGSMDKQSLTNVEQEQRVISLETEIQELKLALNKAKAELEKAQNTNSAEKEELSFKIVGLEKHISSMEGHVDDQVVEYSKLQSQVIVQERQIAYLKLMNTKERENNERLYKEVIEREEKLFQEILRLQSDKVEYVMKIENLEKGLLQSVPKSEMNAISRELAEVRMKYQDNLALSVARCEENSVERLEGEIRLLQREKNEVLDELRSAKEKLTLALSGGITRESSEVENSIIAEKLAASEVRELNEKQKSAHLEKINLMLRSEMQDLEGHNKELLVLLTELKDVKRKYAESEQRATNPDENVEEVRKVLQDKIDNLQKKLTIVENERENFRELFEISRGQFRSLESYKERDKQRINSLNEQVLLLQSTADEKAIIGRLSHELLTCQLSSTQLTNEKNNLRDRVTKLLSKNLFLEAKVDDAREQNFEIRRKHLVECENLHKTINDLRNFLGPFTFFPSVERIEKMKKRWKLVQDEERRLVKDLKNQMEDLFLKEQEMAVKMEGMDALMTAYRGDSKQLIAWYNKGTNMRLEEARCRRQNQFLTGELCQLEEYVKKMDDEIIALEESNLRREREWDQRQMLWEQSQLEMFELLKEKGREKIKPLRSVQDKATETVRTNYPAEGIMKIVEDQAETIKRYEAEIQKSEAEINQLKKDLNEKEVSTEDIPQEKTPEVVIVKDMNEDGEKAALKMTVHSLQNIICQKEETIYKYQDLLKEGREEFSKSSGKFQEELGMLHEALAKQSKAYIKLKNSMDGGHQLKDGLPMIFEKYLTKIQELEDDLAECHMTLASVNRQIMTTQHEKEKWQALAEERLSLKDDLRQRLQADYQKELENYKAEIDSYQLEIERLKRYVETSHNDGNQDHHKDIDIQEKELPEECYSTKEKEIEWSEKGKDKIKNLERQLKFARDESSRLRDQIRLLQDQKSKRPKTASSITSRSGSESKLLLKEESLQSKVKTLEELLRIAKEREKDLIEGNQRRIKSAEEVARWGEKKKAQQTIQNLSSKLKEKEAEIEILRNKNESFRNMIRKIEKDRDALEVQLKAAKDGPSSLTTRIDKLISEKSQLEKEVAELKEKFEMQVRHESRVGATALYDKLESQERKLAVLELASRGRTAIVEELEKLQNSYNNLEKANLKLESENLALLLQVEKEKAKIVRLTERNGELEKLLIMAEEVSEIRSIDRYHSDLSLNEKMGKIQENRPNCKRIQSSRLATCPEELRKDYVKVKDDYKTLRAKYLEQIDKNRELEEELKKCRYQIHLLEEKDLADSIAKTDNLQLTSQLSQELIQVKSQLAHKNLLLNRVKVLLTKAAAKEKALTEKVSALQSMVPA